MSIYVNAIAARAGGGSSAYVPIPRAFGGTVLIAQPTDTVFCQLDLMSIQDAHAYGGASGGEGPHFRYNGFTWVAIILQQGDKLTDTVNVDATTGTNTVYRIIGDPEKFPDTHCEFVVDRVIGT